MVDVAMADEHELAELKAWFFQENIRLNEEKEMLDREKERLKRENELFEKKLEILKRELYKLSVDKKELEQEKIQVKFMKERARAEYASAGARSGSSMFFRGVRNESALKKRYKDLIKIYHPDNISGDKDAIQCINQEFDSLKKRYCG